MATCEIGEKDNCNVTLCRGQFRSDHFGELMQLQAQRAGLKAAKADLVSVSFTSVASSLVPILPWRFPFQGFSGCAYRICESQEACLFAIRERSIADAHGVHRGHIQLMVL